MTEERGQCHRQMDLSGFKSHTCTLGAYTVLGYFTNLTLETDLVLVFLLEKCGLLMIAKGHSARVLLCVTRVPSCCGSYFFSFLVNFPLLALSRLRNVLRSIRRVLLGTWRGINQHVGVYVGTRS